MLERWDWKEARILAELYKIGVPLVRIELIVKFRRQRRFQRYYLACLKRLTTKELNRWPSISEKRKEHVHRCRECQATIYSWSILKGYKSQKPKQRRWLKSIIYWFFQGAYW